jgi:flagellar secretion chaperone FliS
MSNVREYRENKVKTASPMQLILLLYDECLRSLSKAQKAFDIDGPERFETIGNHLLHAQDIITELAVSLDMEQGGEVAKNLHNLYDFMVNHLSDANVKKQPQAIADVQKMMTELREAWQQVEAQGGPPEDAPAQPRGIRISG